MNRPISGKADDQMTMRRRGIGALTAAALGASLILSGAAHGAPAVKRCGSVVFEAGSENGTGPITAKGTTCATARKVARGSAASGPTSGPYSYSKAGFRCRGPVRGEFVSFIAFRCTKGSAIVRFDRF